VYGIGIENLAQFHQFFSSPFVGQLEILQVYYHVGGAHSRPQYHLQDVALPQILSNLQTLEVNFWCETSLGATLAQENYPKLKTICLRASWPFEPLPTPENFKQLLYLPLLRQIHSIVIDHYPEDAILALFSRRDLAFESLALVNRRYYGIVERQEFAYRLTLAGIQAIIESGAIRFAKHLKVEHEHVGDAVLRLVEAIQPGILEKLELIDVGLTDEGAAQLAQLPQLAQVTSLTLSCNQLTAKGIEALLQSRYLKHIRQLDLGSRKYNPYYSFVEPQPVGDEGARILGKSHLFGQLQTLHLANAAVGVDGVTALANVENTSKLRILDLSYNPIGFQGCQALAKTKILQSIRELDLSLCELDDPAIDHLMQANLSNLRVLDLAYNSISEVGAHCLAKTRTLSSLWHLNLHDNFIGDPGLIALAESSWLTNLLELDIEQDVWNYHRASFSREVAEVVGNSSAFARLDEFWAGIVDEYHGERFTDPFSRTDAQTDMDIVINSRRLRPEVRYSLQGYQLVYDLSPEGEAKREALQQELNNYYTSYTPEELETQRRGRDFRT
jgi:hypothetical protein